MRLLSVLTCSLSLAALAAADTVVCKDKRRIEGKIIEETEAAVKVQVKNGAVTIPRYQIDQVIHGATTEEVYQERHDRADPTDTAKLLELARWCEEQGLKKQALVEWQRLLASSPEPEPPPSDEAALAAETPALKAKRSMFLAAHTALKQTYFQGKWMSIEDAARAKGLVEWEGQWVSPEEARLKAALKEQRDLERAIADKVRDCLRKLASADMEAREEARTQLDAIPADLKFAPILENIESRTAEIRAYCIGALSAYRRPEALSRLARRVLVDESEALRNASLDALKKLAHPDSWTHLQKGLTSDYSYVRIRAAHALCDFPNEGAAEALLNALQKAMAPKGGVTFGTSDPDPRLAGGAKMSDEARKALEAAGKVPGKAGLDGGMKPFDDPEQKAKEEQAAKEKAAFVKALEACTGLNYGENLGMWREWYLQKHAATAGKAGTEDKEKPAPEPKK